MLRAIRLKIRRFKRTVRGWIDSALGGSHHHFSCFLPPHLGGMVGGLFRMVFSEITLDQEEIDRLRSIPPEAVVVYATKYKSRLEYFFYHTRYRMTGIRPPLIGFDYQVFLFQPVSRIFRMLLANADHFYQHLMLPDPYDHGFIESELKGGRAAILSLVERRGFKRRFVEANTDPIRFLIDIQKRLDRPIYIVPQIMFFSRNPHRSVPRLTDILFGSDEKPGKIRRLAALIRNPARVFVEVSEPVNLADFLARPENRYRSGENLAYALRRHLLIQINRHRQSITGPILKSREELKESILTNSRLRDFMEQYSRNREIPRHKVRKEADGYLDEIASKYSLATIQFFSMIVRWMINAMFEGYTVNADGLARVKSMARRGPLVLVPCHKSHIDYLILSFVLYHNNMPCPHIAAGKNLSFWPLGAIFRRGGAFFIRRTFRGAVLYSKVFAEYVFKLLEEGFNIEFFIEGGRSRSGKLIAPKFGLLSILLNAFREGACEDLIFAPVYIGYDRVPEESAYLHELEGGQKRPETLSQVIRARKFLKKRYGKIYIQFHEPISLADLLNQRETSDPAEMSQKDQNALCRYLGYRLINAIDRMTVVTPHAVVAAAALNCGKRRFTYEQLLDYIETYMNYLFAIEAKLADTLLVDYIHAVAYVFETYVGRRFIERIAQDKGGTVAAADYYAVNPARRTILDYYKNNGINYFIPAAFTSMAILGLDAFQFSVSDLHDGYGFMSDLFNNEFAYDVDQSPEHFIAQTIRRFTEDAILIPHPELADTYNLTSAGFRKIKLFAAFLRPYFESYWVVLNAFKRYSRTTLDTKNRMKRIESMGSKMFKRREIERQEALSRMNFRNAVDYFTGHGIRGSDDREAIDQYEARFRKYLTRLGS